MMRPTGVHLIGSVPMADAEPVFRAVARELGPWLTRIPDGETGNRHRWIWWQREMLLNHPAMEIDPVTPPFELRRQWNRRRLVRSHRVGSDSGPRSIRRTVTFDTGYAEAAIASYAVFRRLRDAGELPSGSSLPRFACQRRWPPAICTSAPTSLAAYSPGL